MSAVRGPAAEIAVLGGVQTHLAHVFAKLGLTSRAQLAAEATRRGGALARYQRSGGCSTAVPTAP